MLSPKKWLGLGAVCVFASCNTTRPVAPDPPTPPPSAPSAATAGPTASHGAPHAEPGRQHEDAGRHEQGHAGAEVNEPGHGHGHGHAAEPIGHRFEHADAWAGRFDSPARAKWQKPAEVVQVLDVRPDMTVADIGAGTGFFLPWLSRAVGSSGTVLALDIESDMIRYMKERVAREGLANVEPRLATPADSTLGPQSVDRILIVNTWHHIPERAAYAAQLRRALKPRGVVAVVDYTLAAHRGPPKDHRLPPEQVLSELRAGGFESALAAESLPDQYIVLGRLPVR